MSTEARQVVDEATRVVAGATRSRYDAFAIWLHWLTVALVLVQFGLAETWGWFPRADRRVMIMLHMSFGILLAVVVLVRIVWRLTPGHRVAPAVTGLTEQASRAVHALLYALLVAQATSGFILRWSGHESIIFFGLQLPPPFPPVSRPTHHLIGEIHNYMGWSIIVLAAGHALAALYHHFVVKDRVLIRMLPEGRA